MYQQLTPQLNDTTTHSQNEVPYDSTPIQDYIIQDYLTVTRLYDALRERLRHAERALALGASQAGSIIELLKSPDFSEADKQEAIESLEGLQSLLESAPETGSSPARGRGKAGRGERRESGHQPESAPAGEGLRALKDMERSLEEPALDEDRVREDLSEIKRALEDMAEENRKLKAQNSQDNTNSHLSSGSLPGFKRKRRESREPSGRHPGGQEGAPGSAAVMADPEGADEVIPLYPEGYGPDSQGVRIFPGESRLELREVNLTLRIKYQQMCVEVTLPNGKKKILKGSFPEGIRSRITYGKDFQSDATLLDVLGVMSKKRVSDFLDDRYGVTLSPATVTEMLHRSARAVAPAVEGIRERLRRAPVVHFDETTVSLNGKNVYVHTAADKDYTLLVYGRNRGEKGAEDLGVAREMSGVAMSDRFSLYRGKFFSHLTQAFCGAHLLRDLNKAILSDPTQKWPVRMRELLMEMKETAETYRRRSPSEPVPARLREGLLERYFAIIKEGYAENAGAMARRARSGSKGDFYPLTLLEAFDSYWREITLFLKNPIVPFTNNIAEQALRMLKVKMRVSGCFRSAEGLRDYLLVRSYLQTAVKQGLNPIEALEQAIWGNPDYLFTHVPLEGEGPSRREPVMVVSFPKRGGGDRSESEGDSTPSTG